MGQTLTNGIFLPNEGERNCYTGLAENWRAIDGYIGDYNVHVADFVIHVSQEDRDKWDAVDDKADASALTAHTGNTTIHVTAADKETWNGKADASALTAHTGDTTIHVTAADKEAWNGHIADLVKHVTAEDKAKWDAVTSKADDSDVVHKAGSETIGGIKDFSDVLRVYNSNSSTNTAQMWLKNSKVNRGQTVYGDQAIWFRDATDKPVTAVISRVSSFGASALLLYAYNVDQNNQQVSNYLSFTKNLDGTCFLLPDQNDAIVLGSSSAKFKGVNTNKINGFNPGALSLPDLSAGVDISAYITDITGASNINKFTPTADGWISIGLSNADFIEIYIPSSLMGGSFTKSSVNNYGQAFMPVVANKEVRFALKGNTIGWAKFYPCQGNV